MAYQIPKISFFIICLLTHSLSGLKITINNQTNEKITIVFDSYFWNKRRKEKTTPHHHTNFSVPPWVEHYKKVQSRKGSKRNPIYQCYQLWSTKSGTKTKDKLFAKDICNDAAWNVTKKDGEVIFTPK